MNEQGKEFVAKKKWEGWQKACFFGMIVFMCVLLYLTRTIAFMIAFLFVLMALSLYYMINTFKQEYAYTISNKFVCEVLKSSGKRKPICEFYTDDMTFTGSYYENDTKADDADEFFYAAADVRDEGTYIAVFERDGKKSVVFFTPNDMMKGALNGLKK